MNATLLHTGDPEKNLESGYNISDKPNPAAFHIDV